MLLPSGRETEKGAFPRVFWKCSTLKSGEWIVDLGE